MAAAPTENGVDSSLDPTTPAFTMPTTPAQSINSMSSSDGTKAPSLPNAPAAQPKMNGQVKVPKPAKTPKAEKAQSQPESKTKEEEGPAAASASGEKKLSGAELKKQKAAEKAARRKEKLVEKGVVDTQGVPVSLSPASQSQSLQQQQPPVLQRRASGSKTSSLATPSHDKRAGPSSGKGLPVRPAAAAAAAVTPQDAEKEEKKVIMFSHLYNKDRRTSIAGASKEVHPAVLGLGIQLRDYVICGGNARCVATLLVFKKVIQAYTTPPAVALSRHLTIHLSHQISHIRDSRALSVSQGNSIRWLKKLIASLDPDMSDSSAKTFLCDSIDGFIREKITLADELIAREATKKIVDGDVVLTYAKSSIVEKALLAAHRAGKRFQVIVVDSRPLFEGKNLARSLASAGIPTRYCLISGLASVVKKATKCFLGASAMMGNGRLYSRAGTALVALMAKQGAGVGAGSGAAGGLQGGVYGGGGGGGVPVIVLCESVKFTGRVALDSIVGNELGDADSLVEVEENNTLTSSSSALTPAAPTQPAKGGGKKGGGGGGGGATTAAAEDDDDTSASGKKKRGLEGWKDQPNLQLLNLMYDVTPAQYLDMVITELGSLPPSAVPIIDGVWGGEA